MMLGADIYFCLCCCRTQSGYTGFMRLLLACVSCFLIAFVCVALFPFQFSSKGLFLFRLLHYFPLFLLLQTLYLLFYAKTWHKAMVICRQLRVIDIQFLHIDIPATKRHKLTFTIRIFSL